LEGAHKRCGEDYEGEGKEHVAEAEQLREYREDEVPKGASDIECRKGEERGKCHRKDRDDAAEDFDADRHLPRLFITLSLPIFPLFFSLFCHAVHDITWGVGAIYVLRTERYSCYAVSRIARREDTDILPVCLKV